MKRSVYRPLGLAVLVFLLSPVGVLVGSDKPPSSMSPELVLVKGGAFSMGDVFGEGEDNELPVHEVELSDFFICAHEATVAEFGRFVAETGYTTSAEAPTDAEKKNELMQRVRSGEIAPEDMMALKAELLKFGGTAFWDAEQRRWLGYRTDIDWRNPGFAQSDSHPVQAVSVNDAMNYCNWLSGKLELPVAYDLDTGELLDAEGRLTDDITKVRGIRLPTEAEWEYAARQGGQRVRFGNGKEVADASEINFQGDRGDYPYLAPGEYRKGTTPVGSFEPNTLGLFDMSGNAWEWTLDGEAYAGERRKNPCVVTGVHMLRGGRWGGDAYEVRVFSRSRWPRNDRCNNSGFRVARSCP